MGGQRSVRFWMAQSPKQTFRFGGIWPEGGRPLVEAVSAKLPISGGARATPLDTGAVRQGHGVVHIEVVGRHATRRSVMRVSSVGPSQPKREAGP